MRSNRVQTMTRTVLPLAVILAVAFYIYLSPEVGTTPGEIEALGWPFQSEDPAESIGLIVAPVSGSAPLTVEAKAIEPRVMEKAGFGLIHTWYWGDGSLTYAYHLRTHTYDKPGTYTVKLEVEIIKPATAAAVGGCGTASEKLKLVKTATITVK